VCGEVDGGSLDRDDDVARLALQLVPALKHKSSLEAGARPAPQDGEHAAPCDAREARRRRYGPVAESVLAQIFMHQPERSTGPPGGAQGRHVE
jgi:hypothetical protein